MEEEVHSAEGSMYKLHLSPYADCPPGEVAVRETSISALYLCGSYLSKSVHLCIIHLCSKTLPSALGVTVVSKPLPVHIYLFLFLLSLLTIQLRSHSELFFENQSFPSGLISNYDQFL